MESNTYDESNFDSLLKTLTSIPPQSLNTEGLNSYYSPLSQSTEPSAMGLSKRPVSQPSKNNDMLYSTFYYQVRGNKIVRYESSEFRSVKQKEIIEEVLITKNQTYKGNMSKAGMRNMRKKLTVWMQGIESYNSEKQNVKGQYLKKMVFITLTLPASQRHDDRTIKSKALAPFMRILRERFNCDNYIWKAEKQVNGNIHFHVVIDKYIDKFEISRLWNKCIEELCYVSRFAAKFGHSNPPSTKIEMARNQVELERYLAKYVSKESEQGIIEGAVWKCSEKVNSLQFFEYVSDIQSDELLNTAINRGEIKVYTGERYAIYDLCKKSPYMFLHNVNQICYKTYLHQLTFFLFRQSLVTDFKHHHPNKPTLTPNHIIQHITEKSLESVKPTQLQLFDVPIAEKPKRIGKEKFI